MTKRMASLFVWVAMALVVSFALSGCLPGNRVRGVSKPAGFLRGIWHGWIAPLSLIGEIFNRNIRIYEPVNTGLWYDLGFYMAIISGFGGLSLVRKRRREKRDW